MKQPIGNSDGDRIERLNGSLVQHGHHNDRVYLIHLAEPASAELLDTLDLLARRHGYGKVFAKIPDYRWNQFRSRHYLQEACIPRLFNASTDGLLVGKYFSRRRRRCASFQYLHLLVQDQTSQTRETGSDQDPGIFPCLPDDATELSSLYRELFQSYPFPVFQPAYLQAQMRSDQARYCGIRRDGKIVAAAAIELNLTGQFAEMTDFATRPQWRGRGFATALLRRLENTATATGIRTLFTIARAASPGINRVFQKNGYRYGGLLPNNTQISGSIQSMTVWYRHLG